MQYNIKEFGDKISFDFIKRLVYHHEGDVVVLVTKAQFDQLFYDAGALLKYLDGSLLWDRIGADTIYSDWYKEGGVKVIWEDSRAIAREVTIQPLTE